MGKNWMKMGQKWCEKNKAKRWGKWALWGESDRL